VWMRPVVLACLLALAAAAPASAQELLPPPAAEHAPSTVRRGGKLDLAIRSAAPAGSVVIRVSGTGETDDNGRLHGPPGTYTDHLATPGADPTLHEWRPDAAFLARRRPGTYWWQAYLVGAAADGAEDPVGPVESFTVTAPKRTAGRLTPRYGRTNHEDFYLSNRRFPTGVDPTRFRTVIKRSAARWGLKARGWTSAVAGRADGFQVAGFGRVPKKALAMQVDYVKAGRVLDRDLIIRPDLPWALGPGYPAMDEYDLESVLIHELSHFAGNKRHRPRCVNSPLVEAMAAGEWWRGPRDRWSFGCSSAASAASAGLLVHRVVSL
jgi:hypothetical protein